LQEPFPHPDLNWLTPQLLPSRLVYVGLRDVEEEEKKILTKLNIAAFYMADVDELGIVKVVEDALACVDPCGKRNIQLSFDIDALDPFDAPATGCPVRGGLTLWEGLTLCTMVQRTGRLRAMDMVEVNPKLAKDMEEADRTVNAANDIILAALGCFL
jgi:arginase